MFGAQTYFKNAFGEYFLRNFVVTGISWNLPNLFEISLVTGISWNSLKLFDRNFVELTKVI